MARTCLYPIQYNKNEINQLSIVRYIFRHRTDLFVLFWCFFFVLVVSKSMQNKWNAQKYLTYSKSKIKTSHRTTDHMTQLPQSWKTCYIFLYFFFLLNCNSCQILWKFSTCIRISTRQWSRRIFCSTPFILHIYSVVKIVSTFSY